MVEGCDCLETIIGLARDRRDELPRLVGEIFHRLRVADGGLQECDNGSDRQEGGSSARVRVQHGLFDV